jgi:hypothetical protein
LHEIVKELGMEEHDINNVLELAKDNQLQYLQWKVEYLRNDIEMLEVQKTKSTNDILKLNKIVDGNFGTKKRRGKPGTRKVRQHRELVSYRISRTRY